MTDRDVSSHLPNDNGTTVGWQPWDVRTIVNRIRHGILINVIGVASDIDLIEQRIGVNRCRGIPSCAVA